MARKKRSTRAEDDVESLTLREVFEDPDGDGDSKDWLLYAAQCAAEDAGIDIKTIITRAVDHFLDEHFEELHANPKDAFRIPTAEEDALDPLPTEMPDLASTPGWDQLSEEEQEWLWAKTERIISLHRVENAQRGFHPISSQKIH